MKKVIRKFGSSFTPSLKDALEGKFNQEEKQEDAKEVMKYYISEDLEEPFTQEQFEAKWTEFLSRLTDRPNLRTTLSNTPELQPGYKLLLKIGNSVQDEDVRLIKPELVSWLRKELRNTRIELLTQIEKQETTRIIYSDTERLQAMLEKNPDLKLLKQKFNLDFNP